MPVLWMSALAKISTYAADASSPAPTLMDYTDAGVMQVSADNLEAVNMAVAAAASTAADADTLVKIQALATPAIMTAAAKMAVLAKISTYAADASSPAPTLMDYTDAGVMQVSADNLEAVNMAVAAAASTAADADTLVKIQALATPAIMTAAAKMAALAKISTYAADASSPAPTLMDYTDAGVMQVSADNLEAVNMAVAAAASTAADADTLVKIQALATPAIMTAAAKMAALAKISTYAADASNPAPTLMDYTAAGVMDVSADNLEAVNMAVAAAASTAADADTLVKIQALATPAIMTAAAKMAALAKISTYAADASSPAPTLMDYTDAGVMQVSADNLEAVNMAVAAAASTAADADTLVKIQALATPAIMTAAAKMAALAKISTYAADASSPAPTLMDYTDAGVMDVSADNLEAVNMAVAAAASTAADADTLVKIQALATPAIMTAAAKMAALAKISTYAADASSPAPTLMDYTDAGVMQVSADNLEAVNMAVAAAASTAADADTLVKIQALATPAIMTAAAKMAALAKISTYAADASSPAPTLMDYTDAGVMQVSADNLEAVNMAVAAAASTAADADTLVKIQALATPAIMTAAAKMAALAKISTYAADASSPAPTLMDYTDAGVMQVSADNLEAVNMAVAAAASTAADADTLVKIQALATPAIMTAAAKMAALAKISTYAADASNPAPTLMDYTAAGVMDVSADNLEAVNMAVAAAASTAADADTLVKIQALATPAIMTAAAKMAALAKISTYAADASSPAPTLMDYTDAGVMQVSADNLEAVNMAVAAAASTAADADTLVKIQALATPAIMTAAAKMAALAKISTYAADASSPAPTLMDYTDAGVVEVSADNLEAVNMAVAAAASTAADADTLVKIQALATPAIMTAAAKMAALAKISTYAADASNPAPTLMDYTDAGVMQVSADNLEAVNMAVAAAASTAADADTLVKIQALATPAIMTAAAKMAALAKISTYAADASSPAPTLMDYTDAGVMDVSADNLEAVNMAVAAAASTAADADTLVKIQALATPAIMTAAAKMAALAKISTYAADASSPAPTLMDYTDAGVMQVSADNLEAVNMAVAAAASTAADADTLADIQALAAPAIMTAADKMAALAKISTYAADASSPAPTLMDYTDAGVMDVSADNLEAVNMAVAAAASTAADADTLVKIQALATPAIMTAAAKMAALAKISTYAADASSPAPTLMDYTDAGVMQVSADNLEAVNMAVAAAASTAADADTLVKIQALATPAIMTAAAKMAALAKISTYAADASSPAPTLMDYTDAGVMDVSADNLEAVNMAVAAAASTAADADTLVKIQALATPAIMTAAAKMAALAKISTYAADASSPAPTLMDYTDAGVMQVSADNLEAVNMAVAAAASTAADADTLVKIQALATPAIMTAAAKMAALAKISTYAADASSPAPTLMDYTDAGVVEVSADNLEAVNMAVAAAASTAADADTLVKIQALATPAIMTAAAKMAALAKISTYAADASSPAPTLMDYTDAGVVEVSADNLEAVNMAVAAAASTAADADTLVKIQALATPAIMTAAAKMAALAKISTYAADASNPAPTLMDYTDAGVMQVSADNLEAVNMAVAAAASTAAEADTLVKIQALATPAIMTAAAKMAALAKISTYAADASNPAPTLMDYTDAGVMQVSADNLDAVNMAVAAAASTAAEADTLVKIQALATPAIMTAAAKMAALAKISTYAADASSPAPTLMDYTDAGVMDVSADNLEAVNMAVAAAASTAADADTLVKIQALATPAIMTAAAKMAALAKISTYAADASSPAPTLMDYTDAGVMDVSADNLEAVNMAVAAAASTAADADTLVKIQALATPAIMTAAAKMAALAKISTYAADASSPAPTLMDYTDAGVMQVSADNLEAVNMAVAAAASTAADADTLADIQALAAPAIMTAAAKMAALAKISTYAADASSPAPTLMDYTDAGVMDVSADNLEAVNMAVAAAASTAADADTLADIQALATPAIMTAAAKATALAKISTYAGDASSPAPTLMDYTDAGVMGVSADNLEAVNAAVAAASTAADADTLADIQALAAPAIMTAAANMAALAKISTYAGDSSNPAPTLMDYTDAGVMGVSADNIEAVNRAVAAASTAAEADTTADIQTLAAPAIAQSMADDDTGLSPESAKKLNEAILSLVQSMLASTMSAVNSRMDGAFSGRPEVASYQIDGQTVQLDSQTSLSANLHNTVEQKLPTYIKSLKDDTLDWKRLIGNSSFVMPLNALDEDGGGAGVTVWGSGEYINLSDQDWKGDVFSLQLGVDQRMKNDLLAGGLVSWSKGDVDYTLGRERGKYTHRVTSIHPYMARSRDGVNLWGSVGYGQGELSIKAQGDNQSERSSDTRLLSLAAGVSGRLTQYGQSGLSLKSDLSLARTNIDGSADIPADKLSSQRLRLLLEVEQERQLASGQFKPVVEIGLRYDGVGNSSDIGAVLGFGGRYANTTGLTVEGKLHTLVGRKDYKEWGVQGVIRQQSGANEQGLTFSLSPSYGATNNNANQVWEQELADGNNRNDDYRARLDVNMGYGLFTGGGLLTPYSELRMGKNNRYRLGLHWKPNSPFNLHLYGERKTGSGASDRILMESQIRF